MGNDAEFRENIKLSSGDGNREWGRGRHSKTATKIALLLSGDDGMVQLSLFAPLMASIALSFPQAGGTLLDLAMSITATAMLPAMLLASWCARHFDKKYLIIIGTVVFATSGLMIGAAPSLEVIVLMRALVGFGAGFAFPLVPSAIASLFREAEKNQMLGWMNAAGSFLSLILTYLAGVVAALNWRYAFLFYLMFVPIIAFQVFCLPNFKPEKASYAKQHRAPLSTKLRLGWRFWLCSFGLLFYLLLVTSITFRLSLFIETGGLGTSANSGFAQTCMLTLSFITSTLFFALLKVTKRYTPVFSFACLGVALALLCLAQNIVLVYLACIVEGMAMGSMMPYVYACVSRWSFPSKMTVCMSLVSVFQFGAQFLEMFWLMILTALGFGEMRAMFGVESGLALTTAVALAVVFLITKPDYPGKDA